MKIKHVVTSVALSLALGFGAVAGLMANKEAKAAKADGPTSDVTMYVDFSNVKDWWFSDSAVAKAYVWNGEGHEFVSLSLVEKQLYKFTLEAGKTNFLIARLNSAETEWFNQTHDVTYGESFNLITIKDSKTYNKYEYSVSMLAKFSDDYLVFDAYQSSSFWANDSAHIYLYFTYGDGQGYSFYEFGAPLTGTSVYQIRISGYADRFCIVRGTANFAGFVTGWEEEVWNKSHDIIYTSENIGCRYVKLGTPDYEGARDVGVAGFEPIAAAAFVDSYGYHFLEYGLCLDDGGLTEDFATNWSAAKTAFNSMESFLSNAKSEDLKAALKLVDNKEESYAGRAMKRYDTVLAKNEGVENFLGREIDLSLASVYNFANGTALESSATIIIISIVSISALAFTMLLVFKKKKQK